MSDEEIKILKILINNKDVFYYEDDFNNRIRPLVGKLLDLYTKEKEKNKELRNKMKNAENNLKVAISKTIQKSKIREKIGELNNSEWIEDRIAIPYLKELLED